MIEYAVIVEKTRRGFQAYVPDLPGCVAVAQTAQEARELIQKAIGLHLKGLQEERAPEPRATTQVFYVEGIKRNPLQEITEVSRKLQKVVQVAARTGIKTAKTGIETAKTGIESAGKSVARRRKAKKS